MHLFFCLLLFGLNWAPSYAQENDKWEQIVNGQHSIQSLEPELYYVNVPIKIKDDTQVVLVNFRLLKDLGLLPFSAPDQLTPRLEQLIKQSFSIQTTGQRGGGARIATYYADGGIGYNSGIGDGRALWIADLEVNTQQGLKRYDITTKGTGATGLGYKTYPGHSDGLTHIADAYQEYFAGEFLYQSGISDSSRILAIIKTNDTKTLVNGEKVQGSIMVRVSPSNLRYAHMWKHGLAPPQLKKLLQYYFNRDAQYLGVPFEKAVQKLLVSNVMTSAKQAADYDHFLISQLSPTRGNRLLDGQLIDFGTLHVFDLYYPDFSLNKSLGSVRSQKQFALHWNRRMKKTLEQLAPLDHIKVDQLFLTEYQNEQRILMLKSIGLSTQQAQNLKDDTLRLTSNLVELKELVTRKSYLVGDYYKMRLPIVNMGSFLNHLPLMEWVSESKSKQLSVDLKLFLSKHGSSNAKLPFNTKRLQVLLNEIKMDFVRLVQKVAIDKGQTENAICRSFERQATLRQLSNRPAGIYGARLKQMNEWANDFKSGLAPEKIKAKIDQVVFDSISFPVDGAKKIPQHMQDAYSTWKELVRSPSLGFWNSGKTILVPDWFRDFLVSQSDLEALLQAVKEPLSQQKWTAFLDLLRQSFFESDYGALAELGLQAARARPEHTFEIIKNLITTIPGKFKLGIGDDLKFKNILESVNKTEPVASLSLEDAVKGRMVTLELRESESYFSILAKDQNGRLILKDGPRLKYFRSRDGLPALSSSLLTTTVDQDFQGGGIYQEMLKLYQSDKVGIKVIYLNTENAETAEGLLWYQSKLQSEKFRADFLSLDFNRGFLTSMGISESQFLKGDADSIRRALNALMSASLQGRSRLRAGLSLEVVGNESEHFATFESRFLTLEQKQKALDVLQKWENALKLSLTSSERHLLDRLLPESYISFLDQPALVKTTPVNRCLIRSLNTVMDLR